MRWCAGQKLVRGVFAQSSEEKGEALTNLVFLELPLLLILHYSKLHFNRRGMKGQIFSKVRRVW